MKVVRCIALIALAILMMASCQADSLSGGLDPDPNAVVALRITPVSAELAPADTLRFRVQTIRAGGDTVEVSGAVFEASGGSISAAGLYQATASGAYQVRARLSAGPGLFIAVAQVVVRVALE